MCKYLQGTACVDTVLIPPLLKVQGLTSLLFTGYGSFVFCIGLFLRIGYNWNKLNNIINIGTFKGSLKNGHTVFFHCVCHIHDEKNATNKINKYKI